VLQQGQQGQTTAQGEDIPDYNFDDMDLPAQEAPTSGYSWWFESELKDLGMRPLRCGLDPGAHAVSMKHSTACEITWRQERLSEKGLLKVAVLFALGRIPPQYFVGWDYEPGGKVTKVVTQGQFRNWVRQPHGDLKMFPQTTVRIVFKQLEDVLYPAEIYDTWGLQGLKYSWWSQTLKMSITRGKPAMEPEEATQSMIYQKQCRVLSEAFQVFEEEPKPTWVKAKERKYVPYGAEVYLSVEQEEKEDDEKKCWICPALEEEGDGEPLGHRVRPGFTDVANLQVVAVVGTLPGGSTIEVGQPVAVRREPTVEEKRSWELLREAVKEGENGLKEHEARNEEAILHQKLQQGFAQCPAVL
jgi:hypothetical protein